MMLCKLELLEMLSSINSDQIKLAARHEGENQMTGDHSHQLYTCISCIEYSLTEVTKDLVEPIYSRSVEEQIKLVVYYIERPHAKSNSHLLSSKVHVHLSRI